MAGDPLGLQDNPLFKIIGTIFNPDTYRSLSHLGQGQSSAPKSREAMPDYAGMNARQQAGTQPKPKGPSVKKPVISKDKSGKKSYAPKAKVKSRAAKGKAADKMVTMKKIVSKKKKV